MEVVPLRMPERMSFPLVPTIRPSHSMKRTGGSRPCQRNTTASAGAEAFPPK